jgi:hypothetical protein
MTDPTYLAGGDPALADYYPAWLDSLADDVTVEGSMMDGVAVGPEALRTIVGTIRTTVWRLAGVPLRRPLRREWLARGLRR